MAGINFNNLLYMDKLKTKIKKWYNVDKETYLKILDLAKERLEDALSESESITDKAIKIVIALVAFTGFFTGYLLTNHDLIIKHLTILAWSGAAILGNVSILVALILPKKVKNKGLPPIVALVDDFDAKEDKKFQMELLLYNSVSVIQENIDYMNRQNNARAKIYLWALMLFLILTAIIPFVVVFVISHP
jgi:hypothetical protein